MQFWQGIIALTAPAGSCSSKFAVNLLVQLMHDEARL